MSEREIQIIKKSIHKYDNISLDNFRWIIEFFEKCNQNCGLIDFEVYKDIFRHHSGIPKQIQNEVTDTMIEKIFLNFWTTKQGEPKFKPMIIVPF